MANRLNSRDTEFIYASAYISSISGRGLGRELLSRMLEARDAAECEAYLSDAYPGAGKESGIDALCDGIIEESHDTVAKIVPQPEIFAFLRYPYDCANVKAAIKCAARGISADGMLFSCGTLPREAYTAMVESGDYSPLPELLANAARSASSAYARTADPQKIDLPLDAACFEAMTAGAERTENEFIISAVKLRADIVNILTAFRIIRMNPPIASDLLDRAYCPGGDISKRELLSALGEGGDERDTDNGGAGDGTELLSLLRAYGFSDLAERIDLNMTAGEAERICEDYYLSFVYSKKNVTFGCELPFLYLISTEYNVKNARIIAAGKRAGLDADKIRERMRLFYV